LGFYFSITGLDQNLNLLGIEENQNLWLRLEQINRLLPEEGQAVGRAKISHHAV